MVIDEDTAGRGEIEARLAGPCREHRLPPGAHQDLPPLPLHLTLRGPRPDEEGSMSLYDLDPGPGNELHLAVDAGDLARDVLLLTRQDPIQGFHNANLGPQGLKDVRHFHADHPAPDDEEVLGRLREGEDVVADHHARSGQHPRKRGPRPAGDDHLAGGEMLAPHPEASRPLQGRGKGMDIDALIRQQVFDALDQAGHDALLAPDKIREIDTCTLHLEAEAARRLYLPVQVRSQRHHSASLSLTFFFLAGMG